MKDEGWKNSNTIWVDVGESLPWRVMETLKYCVIGSWENPPDSHRTALELEGWAKTAWRLKGSLMVAFLNQDLLFMEFEILEEAKRVLEARRRWFRGGSLKLNWWRLDFGCVNNKENVEEAWIRDSCGGFLAIDKEIALRVKVSWARILVKLGGMARPSVVNILEGKRSFKLQI